VIDHRTSTKQDDDEISTTSAGQVRASRF